jgi:hypothetical protein
MDITVSLFHHRVDQSTEQTWGYNRVDMERANRRIASSMALYMSITIFRAVEMCYSLTSEGHVGFWVVHIRGGMSTGRAAMVAILGGGHYAMPYAI